MIAFDTWILAALNNGAGQAPRFDLFVDWLSHSPLVKGCVAAAGLWALWCGSAPPIRGERREVLLATAVAALLAQMGARLLALALPYRPRPLHEPRLNFTTPHGMSRDVLEGWSSFPSDHAILFFALATGFWFASRPAGAWMFAFATIVICLPRLYLGLHYPTDLIAGALLGVAFVAALQRPAVRGALARPLLYWERHGPYSFYFVAWMFLYQLARMFEDLRWLFKVARDTLRSMV